jgi:hypothetical protein
MDNLVAPVYNGKESINAFQRRVNDFLVKLKKQNYDIIIKFFNKLLNYEHHKHSLTLFKNITHDDLIKKIADNKQVFQEYSQFFEKEYNLSYNITKISDSVYAISTIRQILKTQQCYLKSMEKNIDNKNTLFYSIVILK